MPAPKVPRQPRPPRRANGKTYYNPDDKRKSVVYLRDEEREVIQRAAEMEGLPMTDILRLGGLEKARKILKRGAEVTQ